MKAIIDGKTYNTDTAEEISSFDNGLSSSDFNHLAEKIYKTKNGTYFLAGDGGARSKYGINKGDYEIGGEGLDPISESEALETLERWEDVDAIDKHFSHMIKEA